ncbi:MAG: DEAD/DEAH box helicase [Gordonia sp. (in: high G+C Gram-positive bacteria)]|uniref:DUF3427 domain-containing protein n=1 Tax=Gordonia sp. (in: high G+C Gram-positive bacteria) TaxID=84139 RepID=UPI003C71F843
MNPKLKTSENRLVRADTTFGFLDASAPSEQVFHPQLISNCDDNTMLRAIRHELHRSNRFVFSVAFVTTGALALLKQALVDFNGEGTIVTSTYLNFNEPAAFRELLTLEGVEVLVHPDVERGFHAKGYLFERDESTTAIIGSSNLTSTALLTNEEWNLRFSALPGGDIVDQLRDAIDRQVSGSSRLTASWVAKYEHHYAQLTRHPSSESQFQSDPHTEDALDSGSLYDSDFSRSSIMPNTMQVEALEAIDQVRRSGERRAVVISATGTGKTILSALDVRAFNPNRMLFVVHREQILDAAITAYQQVLEAPANEFGKFVGRQKDLDHKYVFATIQSLSRPENLAKLDSAHFDYVLIDEVHRAGADSYKRLIDRIEPAFLLGLTATPERTDGFNVFEMFDFNVPYEIRLQAALEADMLAPFHYYGVTDFVDSDGTTIDDASKLSQLIAEERVDYLVQMLHRYGHTEATRGLIFCARRNEAIELSQLLNQRVVHGSPLRTRALMGSDSPETRREVVRQLECGELDYILTVDIFNEGIDIPAVNQVVMLRQTQSSIVFTQQLGRGLRKAPDKDHLRVIDFIGNYANNYLIPIALLGDSSLNKDVIRRKLIDADNAGVISGLSSINFDQISRDRVLQSLSSISLDSMKNIKAAYLQLEQRLGKIPKLIDFARFETVDPVVIATKKKNYWALLQKLKREEEEPPNEVTQILNFVSGELLPAKRPHELLLLNELLAGRSLSKERFGQLLTEQGLETDAATIESVERVLSLEFFTASEREKYGDQAPIIVASSGYSFSPRMGLMLSSSNKLRAHIEDLVETGLYLARHQNGWTGELQIGKLYSRKDVCRLLNWKSNEYSTIYGYKVDAASRSCPIFVTYHKSDEVSESTQYEDEFLDASTLKWFTRSRRTLQSSEVQSIVENEFPLHLFAKKDDAEGLDFTYLGLAKSREPVQEQMPGGSGKMLDVVTMKLDLMTPMDTSLFRYLVTGSNGTSE